MVFHICGTLPEIYWKVLVLTMPIMRYMTKVLTTVGNDCLRHVLLFYNHAQIMQSLVFLYLSTIYQVVIHLPWNLYYTFVLEAAHGFNKYVR